MKNLEHKNAEISLSSHINRHVIISNNNTTNFDKIYSNNSASINQRDFIQEYPFADLLKRYTMLKIIGEGGNGYVYSAIDNYSKMMVAIKQIKMDRGN